MQQYSAEMLPTALSLKRAPSRAGSGPQVLRALPYPEARADPWSHRAARGWWIGRGCHAGGRYVTWRGRASRSGWMRRVSREGRMVVQSLDGLSMDVGGRRRGGRWRAHLLGGCSLLAWLPWPSCCSSASGRAGLEEESVNAGRGARERSWTHPPTASLLPPWCPKGCRASRPWRAGRRDVIRSAAFSVPTARSRALSSAADLSFSLLPHPVAAT